MFPPNFNPLNQKPPGPQMTAGDPTGPEGDKGKQMRGKVLRYMFNPEFGQSVRHVGETHSLFLRLLANVFLQTRMIDSTYPGLQDESQLKLITLLTTAWRRLEFTQAGLPQVLLFFAFVGSAAAVVLAILAFILKASFA
jgi:hypothetical protein